MREFGIPVMFDVTAADNLAAARTLHDILAALDLPGSRVRDITPRQSPFVRAWRTLLTVFHLRDRHVHDEARLESWWFVEPAHKTIDGNDNDNGEVVFLDGSDRRTLDHHELEVLHLGLSTALTRYSHVAGSSNGELCSPELAAQMQRNTTDIQRLLSRITESPVIALLGSVQPRVASSRPNAKSTVEPDRHLFTVAVSGCTAAQASQVVAERLGCDEDYGFDYKLDWTTATHDATDASG